MGNKIKDIDIKNRTYYFFDDIINISLNQMMLSLNQMSAINFIKSYKNILIYYIGYVTIKDSKYVKIIS